MFEESTLTGSRRHVSRETSNPQNGRATVWPPPPEPPSPTDGLRPSCPGRNEPVGGGIIQACHCDCRDARQQTYGIGSSWVWQGLASRPNRPHWLAWSSDTCQSWCRALLDSRTVGEAVPHSSEARARSRRPAESKATRPSLTQPNTRLIRYRPRWGRPCAHPDRRAREIRQLSPPRDILREAAPNIEAKSTRNAIRSRPPASVEPAWLCLLVVDRRGPRFGGAGRSKETGIQPTQRQTSRCFT